ncbi:MAG: hypothetical protein NC912_05220 [Candidatus Omnitrophica bacterium]|nr:hypothetical protein [Candidatus Omnitrophota bacterium]
MKKKNLRFMFIFLFILFSGIYNSTAQENLTKSIDEINNAKELFSVLAKIQSNYLRESKYNDFIKYLQSLLSSKKNLSPVINYYLANTRYQQLKYLEENQQWDEYFSQGNIYRSQITELIQKVINNTSQKDPLHIYARLILWRFFQDMHHAFAENALKELIDSIFIYAQENNELTPIKETADLLFSYNRKQESKQLYRIYIDNLISSDIDNEELLKKAKIFFEEGNLELAELLYDTYIERIIKTFPKQELYNSLVKIAMEFVYKDYQLNDPEYAEKIFTKIEAIGLNELFEEETIYLRGFNLEKKKDYRKAKDIYIDLIQRYSQTKYLDKVLFKLGLIHTYILKEIDKGRDYFLKLSQPENPGLYGILSLYQLGLLSQWEGKLQQAKDYYQRLILNVKEEDFKEVVVLTQERLKEIQEIRPLEYNLKTFLDTCLKEEKRYQVELKAHPYVSRKEQEVKINASVFMPESGCLQAEVNYLWSGNLGSYKPALKDSEFIIRYIQSGTKAINLVAISPSGIIDYEFDIVDID